MNSAITGKELKTKFTREQHQNFAARIRAIRGEMQAMQAELLTSYPVDEYEPLTRQVNNLLRDLSFRLENRVTMEYADDDWVMYAFRGDERLADYTKEMAG